MSSESKRKARERKIAKLRGRAGGLGMRKMQQQTERHLAKIKHTVTLPRFGPLRFEAASAIGRYINARRDAEDGAQAGTEEH